MATLKTKTERPRKPAASMRRPRAKPKPVASSPKTGTMIARTPPIGGIIRAEGAWDSLRSGGGDRRSAAAELRAGARARQRGGALVLVAEVDAPLGQVVGRHLDGDAVAGQDADAVLLHLARGVGE